MFDNNIIVFVRVGGKWENAVIKWSSRAFYTNLCKFLRFFLPDFILNLSRNMDQRLGSTNRFVCMYKFSFAVTWVPFFHPLSAELEAKTALSQPALNQYSTSPLLDEQILLLLRIGSSPSSQKLFVLWVFRFVNLAHYQDFRTSPNLADQSILTVEAMERSKSKQDHLLLPPDIISFNSVSYREKKMLITRDYHTCVMSVKRFIYIKLCTHMLIPKIYTNILCAIINFSILIILNLIVIKMRLCWLKSSSSLLFFIVNIMLVFCLSVCSHIITDLFIATFYGGVI